MNLRRILTFVCLCTIFAVPTIAVSADQPKPKSDTSWKPAKAEAIEHWRQLRFGMFIHWGPVSIKGTEIGWSRGAQIPIEEYDSLYKQFNPTKFNADQWVDVAKSAGMKYVIITTKHHDGFCIFDTKLTDFNIMNSPFKRDVVKELALACKKQDISFGTYYSVCDWHHPDFPLTSPGGRVKRSKSNLDAYNDYLLGQIKELVTNYGPLLAIWNDVPQQFQGRGAKTINMVRELQPDILINNRTGDGGDFETPEQRVGNFSIDRPWETCMTICHQWAWKPNDSLKSLKECIDILVNCAGGDGNLLLNVGPMPTGEIEARQVVRLKEIGDWMKKHGETIYGTRGGPFMPNKQIASTRKGSTIFVHVLSWKGDTVKLPAIPAKILKSRVLTGGEGKVVQTDSGIEISVPADCQAIDTIVALDIDKPAMEIAPIAAAGIPHPTKKK